MKLQNFIEGLKILQKYFNDPNGYHLGAEHDQIYVYATNNPLSEEDINKLLELGWFQDENDIIDGECDQTYNPESSWSVYT